MSIVEKGKAFLIKLRSLPDTHKKIILWTIVVILAAVMIFFWFNKAKDRFNKLAESGDLFGLPNIDISGMPSLDLLSTTTPSNESVLQTENQAN